MSKKTELESLMDVWEAKHRQKGYKRFIRTGWCTKKLGNHNRRPKCAIF